MATIKLGCKTHNMHVHTTSITQSSKTRQHGGFHEVSKFDVTRVAGTNKGGINLHVVQGGQVNLYEHACPNCLKI
jgi:hypothetical protein